MFSHPLHKQEIINLCDNNIPEEEYDLAFKELIAVGKCFEMNGYYSLQEDIDKLIDVRLLKEKEAKKYYNKLPFFVQLIGKFPFVRGVAISGSLSKGVMYKDGDIDYFIITAPDRLWICRTLLVLFKKVFLLNSKKYFCVNYFVDENNLEIFDKNMFTAVEIAYLIPVFNAPLIEKLKINNDWTQDFFPNFKHPLDMSFNTSKRKTKKGVEIIFGNKWGDGLDLWLMKFTFKRWQKKFSHFKNNKFELTMRTNRGVSKHHPQDFQNKVLNGLDERIMRINN